MSLKSIIEKENIIPDNTYILSKEDIDIITTVVELIKQNGLQNVSPSNEDIVKNNDYMYDLIATKAKELYDELTTIRTSIKNVIKTAIPEYYKLEKLLENIEDGEYSYTITNSKLVSYLTMLGVKDNTTLDVVYDRHNNYTQLLQNSDIKFYMGIEKHYEVLGKSLLEILGKYDNEIPIEESSDIMDVPPIPEFINAIKSIQNNTRIELTESDGIDTFLPIGCSDDDIVVRYVYLDKNGYYTSGESVIKPPVDQITIKYTKEDIVKLNNLINEINTNINNGVLTTTSIPSLNTIIHNLTTHINTLYSLSSLDNDIPESIYIRVFSRLNEMVLLINHYVRSGIGCNKEISNMLVDLVNNSDKDNE